MSAASVILRYAGTQLGTHGNTRFSGILRSARPRSRAAPSRNGRLAPPSLAWRVLLRAIDHPPLGDRHFIRAPTDSISNGGSHPERIYVTNYARARRASPVSTIALVHQPSTDERLQPGTQSGIHGNRAFCLVTKAVVARVVTAEIGVSRRAPDWHHVVPFQFVQVIGVPLHHGPALLQVDGLVVDPGHAILDVR